MAFYQVLYWQDIPTQIKVWDDFDELKSELPGKFLAKVDRTATKQGLTCSEAYLDQWRWGEPVKREGTLEHILEKVKIELEEKF
jgi:hypothetical protein